MLKDDFLNAKVLSTRLKQGDALIIRTGGGGGFGKPEERDPAKVANDVRQGYVSPAVAKDTYKAKL